MSGGFELTTDASIQDLILAARKKLRMAGQPQQVVSEMAAAARQARTRARVIRIIKDYMEEAEEARIAWWKRTEGQSRRKGDEPAS